MDARIESSTSATPVLPRLYFEGALLFLVLIPVTGGTGR